MGEKLSRIARDFRFNNEELKNILIIVIVFAFILGFDDGSDTFEMGRWVANFIGSIFIAAIGFLIHISAQKIWAISKGVKIHQTISWYGLGIGAILALVSRGAWTVYLPGSFRPTHSSHQRIGEWRHGLNTDMIGEIALAGPIANIVLAMIVKWVLFQMLGIDALWIDNLILFNFLVALFTMLPLPGQSGLFVFFGSRLIYVIGLGTIIGYVILFVIGILSLFGALAIGVVIWLIYYIFFERLAW